MTDRCDASPGAEGPAPLAPAPDRGTTEGPAAAAFFVPDLIQLDVRRGDRVVVVSDLHLAPVASEVSTQAADELSELLNGFHEPGMLVIAGDGFEMIAAAPDITAILDSHPQFTDAVKRFAQDRDHHVVLTPGNHDGQLAWDGDSVAVLRDRLGVTDLALACDLAVEAGDGGFSMTLSRMFDDRDTGLLLAVCLDPDGMPVAFNQYVPASHVNGYSLDLMRRTSNPDAPNGLTDFVILETINWMAERELNGLGLNFAVMRAVVAGAASPGRWRSAERSLFHRFSDSMQIESLWNFNKKYDPQWRARYSVADDRAHLPRAGLAIARAESVSELPVVGRFMQPRTPAADNQPKELVS